MSKNDGVPHLPTEDTEICYTGTGPPIVLVHGWTADSVDWSWLIPALTEEEFRAGDPRRHVVLRDHSRLADHARVPQGRDAVAHLARRECPVLVINRDAGMGAYEETTFRHPASRAVVMSVTTVSATNAPG